MIIKSLLLSILVFTGKSADYGRIAFFNTTECPQGWELYNPLQGRFPIAPSSEYPLLSTGGEYTHTLTVGEVPAHAHTYNNPNYPLDTHSGTFYHLSGGPSAGESQTLSTGGGQPHNNMPPYLSLTACQKKSPDASEKKLLQRIIYLEKKLLALEEKIN